MKALLALLLCAAACAALGEQPSAPQLTPNQERLAQILLDNQGDSGAATRRADDFLNSLPPDQALDAEAGLLQLSRKTGYMTRVQYARAMLAANLRFAPAADLVHDYWRYAVLISTRLEKGEISQEEFDYLQGRKIMEFNRAVEADRRTAEERRRSAAEAAYRAQAEADADETARNLQMLQSVRQAFRPRAQAPRTVNCLSTPAGGYVTTTCN